jgi:hypothetical protein
MSRLELIKRIALSLAFGLVLTIAVGWVKLAAIDKPAFRAAVEDCFKDPLCDPTPYISMGWPFVYGVNNDATGSIRVVALHNAPEEYDGGKYTDDYVGFALDLVIFSLLSFAGLLVYRLVRHWRLPFRR